MTLDLTIYEVSFDPFHSMIMIPDERPISFAEDLTHCAISEVTGRIVLGNRAGQVMVL